MSFIEDHFRKTIKVKTRISIYNYTLPSANEFLEMSFVESAVAKKLAFL